MPHTIHFHGAGERLRDAWKLPGATLQIFRTSADDALVMAARTPPTMAPVMRDGVAMLGGVAIVRWGNSAIVRVDGCKIEIRWSESDEPRCGVVGEKCRLCYAACADEIVTRCACGALFHQASCDIVRCDCPSCGRPRR